MTIKNKALKIIHTLQDHNYEGFLIGGSVRNRLHNEIHLNKLPIKDYDIVTNASYEVVTKMFDVAETRGEQFKVAVVNSEGDEFEVAQYRGESYPEEGSLRPSEVYAVSSLFDDIQRRDFTINGIAEKINGDIIDYVGGVDDIKNKIIRAIGDSNKRFAEDPLRILRAFRFMSQMGYTIEEKTLQGIKNNLHRLSIIPHERVSAEIEKILKGGYVLQTLLLMKELKVNNFMFYNSITRKKVPLLDKVLSLPMSKITTIGLRLINLAKKDITTLYAALYSEVDWDSASQEMANSMFMSSDHIRFTTIVLKHKELVYDKTPERLLQLLHDLKGKFENRASLNEILDDMESVFNFGFHESEILSRPLFKQELPFTGEDVIKEGLRQGFTKSGPWVSKVIELSRDCAVMNKPYDLFSMVSLVKSYMDGLQS